MKAKDSDRTTKKNLECHDHILFTKQPGEIHHALSGASLAAFWLELLHMPNVETMEIIP
jgi:hypothetical protein